ncbi:DUF488 family protein, N3 subclade [Halomarina oriensis]|uniref:DUF488 family protein n=1 Tax=Halomarina oriensis TaxID=671145 RepID=A0A6B0GP61_9EURY|nr:DUF488 family protein [Halomarina oriensis]MWG35319.1 DUF488 family protein [Halomarina oriensis]
MCAPAPLGETYVAALQHGLVDVPTDTTLVGVVSRPTHWFGAAVDENRPALGPPGTLLDDVEQRREDLKRRGICDEGAHNAAWEDVEFEERYRTHLDTDPDARDAVDELVDRLRAGEPLFLVCFENTAQKRCHRTLLREHVTARLDRG